MTPGGSFENWSPNAQLWRALEVQDDDSYIDERARLRTGLRDMRRRAARLAEQIETDFPELTIHDVSHLDALWPLADTSAGEGVVLTPAEAFLFGAAVLLHDLGLALAAYPGGRPGLRTGDAWRDAVALQLRRSTGRAPTENEITSAEEDVLLSAERALLRARHAARAAELGVVWWGDGDEREYLIAEEELREDFGHLAGQIAASHWWPVSELPTRLPSLVGAPADFPHQWTMRPVLVASLLRVADAAHLAGRAPRRLRATRALPSESVAHWDFQARMLQPVRHEGRLRFAASSGFPITEAQAWWLCFDTLSDVARELRAVDSLLADVGGPRFAARAVVGIENPGRLASLIPTDGWDPVDASVQVSDVAQLVSRLGGRQLYGIQPWVPLRELIQNAADAVRAREALQAAFKGGVTVRVGSTHGCDWLEVEDDGIGMEQDVLTGALLDFGRSLWESPELAHLVPGLAGSGWQPTGRFGIGFFSVFMWTDRVDVISRPFRGAEADTRVLTFPGGLETRPVLRAAAPPEQLDQGGTRIRLWLGAPLAAAVRESWDEEQVSQASDAELVGRLCSHLCPALPTDLSIDSDGSSVSVVRANDWLEVDSAELIERVAEGRRGQPGDLRAQDRARIGGLLRIITDDGGTPVARAALLPARLGAGLVQSGVLVNGGIRVRWLARTAGVWLATDPNAARDRGRGRVTMAQLAPWATEQARLVATLAVDGEAQQEHAKAVVTLGGDPGRLAVCRGAVGWLSLEEVSQWAKDRHQVRVCDLRDELEVIREAAGLPDRFDLRLDDDVLDLDGSFYWENELLEIPHDPPKRGELRWAKSLEALIWDAVAIGWGLTGRHDIESEERDQGDALGEVDGNPLEPVYYLLRAPSAT